jgi:hypothetical protein
VALVQALKAIASAKQLLVNKVFIGLSQT